MDERGKEFLGKGWAFPFAVEPDRGRVALSAYEDDVRESIRIILGTKQGERQMRPRFGCGIHDLVFGAINTALITSVQRDVSEALREFEPRIEVDAGSGRPALRGRRPARSDHRLSDSGDEPVREPRVSLLLQGGVLIMVAPYPSVDERRADELLAELVSMARAFLPAWSGATTEGDAGTGPAAHRRATGRAGHLQARQDAAPRHRRLLRCAGHPTPGPRAGGGATGVLPGAQTGDHGVRAGARSGRGKIARRRGGVVRDRRADSSSRPRVSSTWPRSTAEPTTSRRRRPAFSPSRPRSCCPTITW